MSDTAISLYRLLRRWRELQRRWGWTTWWGDHQAELLLLGLGVGLVAGFAEIAFRLSYAAFQYLSLGFGSELVVSMAATQPWWRLVLGPALGGLGIGLFVHFLMPGRRPQAVAEVIQAAATRHGRMPFWTGVKAALVNAASIGVGASVGREGPMVHLGATLGSAVARLFRLRHSSKRTLLGCGVAAGVAASFNAPIAGVFFALEVVVGHYRLHAFAPIVIASVAGTMVSRVYHGHLPAFLLSKSYEMATAWEFVPFAVLGVLAAATAVAFMAAMMHAGPLIARTRLPVWLRPAVAGLIVGAVAAAGLPHILGVGYEATDNALTENYGLGLLAALAAAGLPHILGVGYEATDNALTENYGLGLLAALVAAKLLATALCFGAGFGGGVFSPSLYMGAMLGGAYGLVVTELVPAIASSQGAYTIVGMGAVAGSVLGAPISTILIVFEMTSNYELTVAVMIATVIASVITQNVFGPSLFLKQLESRGVDLDAAEETGLMRDVRIADMLDEDCPTAARSTPIATVRRMLARTRLGEVYVLDDEGRLAGAVSYRDLVALAENGEAAGPETAGALMHTRLPVLTMGDSLARAVELFDSSGVGHLPVVSDRREMRFVGVAHAHDLVRTYRGALRDLRQGDREAV